MTTRLQDNRESLAMTQEEADKLFQAIAEITIHRTAIAATYDKELTAIKMQAEEEDRKYFKTLKPLEESLSAYITSHRDLFTKPRMKVTEFGKYGLCNATKLEITNKDTALISCKAQDIPAIVLTEKLDKGALKTAIIDGKIIAGVELQIGEIVKYNVKKELLNKVK